MSNITGLRRVLLAAAGCLASSLASSQVPPHTPGTVCGTRTFWCWASPPGPPGTQCVCPSPYGLVPGIRM